jgi:hypothetical protein
MPLLRRILPTLLLWPAAAHATMLGNPVSDPAAGRVALGISGDAAAVMLSGVSCEGDACLAVNRPLQLGGRVELTLLRGLGLHGGGAWLHQQIGEAAFEGEGSLAYAGLDGALPLGSDLHLAAVVQIERSLSIDHSGSASPRSQCSTMRAQAAGLIAWAPDDHSFAAYGGAAFHPHYQQRASLEDLSLELSFQRAFPVAAVLGVELRSQPLGLPWATNSGRMVFGFEAQVERGVTGGLWLGAAF